MHNLVHILALISEDPMKYTIPEDPMNHTIPEDLMKMKYTVPEDPMKFRCKMSEFVLLLSEELNHAPSLR